MVSLYFVPVRRIDVIMTYTTSTKKTTTHQQIILFIRSLRFVTKVCP